MNKRILTKDHADKILDMHEREKLKYTQIANVLNSEGFTTEQGCQISSGTISRLMISAGYRRVKKYKRRAEVKTEETEFQLAKIILDSNLDSTSKKKVLAKLFGG